jgi:hypothetical protein
MPQKHESPALPLPGLSEPDHAGKPIYSVSNKNEPELQAATGNYSKSRNTEYGRDWSRRQKPSKALLMLWTAPPPGAQAP